MKMTQSGLLSLLIASLGLLVGLPNEVCAQDMSFSLDETVEGDTGMVPEEPADEASGDDEDFIAALAADSDSGAEEQDKNSGQAAEKETPEEIYAVQQIYALRLRRFELTPQVGITLNDPFVSHPSLGFAANYWITNVLAVGASFQWYQGLENESDLTFFVRRSTRLAVPISEYQLGTHLNATYVPFYGKFSMFNKYIFQWDAYAVGGLGLVRTRPVAVIDPEARSFDFGNRLSFNLGIGIRIFVTRWLAVVTELRDYIFLDKVESRRVALGAERFNSNTWLDSGVSFVNNVTVHAGITIFFPFNFEYRKPK